MSQKTREIMPVINGRNDPGNIQRALEPNRTIG